MTTGRQLYDRASALMDAAAHAARGTISDHLEFVAPDDGTLAGDIAYGVHRGQAFDDYTGVGGEAVYSVSKRALVSSELVGRVLARDATRTGPSAFLEPVASSAETLRNTDGGFLEVAGLVTRPGYRDPDSRLAYYLDSRGTRHRARMSADGRVIKAETLSPGERQWKSVGFMGRGRAGRSTFTQALGILDRQMHSSSRVGSRD